MKHRSQILGLDYDSNIGNFNLNSEQISKENQEVIPVEERQKLILHPPPRRRSHTTPTPRHGCVPGWACEKYSRTVWRYWNSKQWLQRVKQYTKRMTSNTYGSVIFSATFAFGWKKEYNKLAPHDSMVISKLCSLLKMSRSSAKVTSRSISNRSHKLNSLS